MRYVSVGKTSCINRIAGSMRLVRLGDNPNKKTLIYIPYTSLHQQLSIYNQNCLSVGMSIQVYRYSCI